MIDDRWSQLWLFRPKPLDDELLSSWLVRCSYANARKLHAFCTQVWGSRHHFWERDIDRASDIKVLAQLAESTNLPRHQVFKTTLAAYEGVLFEIFARNGPVPWIMPIVKVGRDRRGFGMQFCPQCLATDETPYYRRYWRLSCAVICPVHKCYLHDCCPGCGAPVTFHQSDYGSKASPYAPKMTLCKKCGLDRKEVPPVSVGGDEHSARLLGFQGRVYEAIKAGWAVHPEFVGQYLMSIAFFRGLHDLIRFLCSASRTGKIREDCLSQAGINCSGSQYLIGHFDEFRHAQRVEALKLVTWFLEDWPARFVVSAKAQNISSSYLLSYRFFQPAYWYYSAVDWHLNRSLYQPSDTETASCRSYLETHGMLVSKNNLMCWLGRWYLDKARYKKK